MITEMFPSALQRDRLEVSVPEVQTGAPQTESARFIEESSTSLVDVPDATYAELAEKLEEAGYIGTEESEEFLRSILEP